MGRFRIQDWLLICNDKMLDNLPPALALGSLEVKDSMIGVSLGRLPPCLRLANLEEAIVLLLLLFIKLSNYNISYI